MFLKWAGVEGNLHQGRHTLGTKAARKGDLKTVMEMLGHRNITTTQIYVHSDKATQRALKDAL